MKRIFSLLALLTLVAVIAAVTASANTSSGTGEVSLLSRSKTYTLVNPPSAAYPDTEAFKLTDGIFGDNSEGAYYKSNAYVGFNRSSVGGDGNIVIILDLGDKYTGIGKFRASYANETDLGIYAPEKVTVAISDTFNGTYTEVGAVAVNESDSAGVSTVGVAEIVPDSPVSGQYVRFTVAFPASFDNNGTAVNPGWLFLDEIEVNSDNSLPQTGDRSGYAFLLTAATVAAAAYLGIKSRKLFPLK